MPWLKLVHPILVLGWVAWLYAKNGWRAGYKVGQRGDVPVAHEGVEVVVQEMQSKIGWPVWALLEIRATRRWSFHVRPEPRIRLRREIEAGHSAFDDAFWIAPGSESFGRALLERDALHRHFLALQRWLPRENSKLSRVAAEDGRLAVEFNVRWVHDRPRLYRRMLAWLVELDRLLSADVGQRPEVEQAGRGRWRADRDPRPS
jgi:hypothetical protein